MNEPNENGYGSTGYGENGYGGNGYEPNGIGANASNALGSGDTAYQRDLFSDGYQENVFANNFADSPYTETSASPDGSGGSSYSSYAPLDYSDDQLEL